MPGVTPPKWGRFSDEQVRQAVRIIRQLHDLTRGSSIAAGAVVCHNDAGPNNFVFLGDVVAGLIDFDMAAPGDPLEDLGYMAWSWCVSSKPDRGSAAVQAQQVRVLADAYGATLSQREKLPDSIVGRQLRNGRYWSARIANPGSAVISIARMHEMVEWSEREARYTEAHRDDLAAALLC
jgi:thiamine kinase-like enzyme